jgi:transcriptional regulator with XRE-family HTH domain
MRNSLTPLNVQSQAVLNLRCLAALYSCPMSTTGERLRQLRKQKNLTLEEIGEICDVSKGMVSQWENNIVTPPIERMILLRKRYHFKLDWLYCEDGEFRPDIEALYAVAETLPVYAVAELTKEGNSFAKLIDAEKESGTQ